MAKRWELFPVGETVPLAGLSIMRMIHQGDTQRTTLYRIRFACCGSERDMSHEQIRSRQKALRGLCKPCSNKITGERSKARAEQEGHVIGSQFHRKRMGKVPDAPPYGVIMPPWPPRKGDRGHWLPMR